MAIGNFGGIGIAGGRGFGDPMGSVGNAFGPSVDLGLSNGLQGNINPGTGALVFAGEAFGLPGGFVSLDPNTGSLTATIETPQGAMTMDLNSALAIAGDGSVAPGGGSSARGIGFGYDRPMDPAALQNASTGFGFGPVGPPAMSGQVIAPEAVDPAMAIDPAMEGVGPSNSPQGGFMGFAPSGALESTISGLTEAVASAARAADLDPTPGNIAALEALQGELANAIAALDAADTPGPSNGIPGVGQAMSMPGSTEDDFTLDPTSPEGIEKGLQDLGHGRGFNGIEGTQTSAERAAALGLGGRSNLGGDLPGDDDDPASSSNAFAAPENAPSYSGGSYANEMESLNSGFIGEIAQGGPNAGAAREGISNAISGFNGVIGGLESRAADLEAEIAADQGLVSGLEGMMDAMGTAAAGRGSDREGARGQGFGNIGTSEEVGNAFAMDGLENGPGLAGSFGGGDVGSDMAAASAGLDLGDRTGGFARDLTGFTPGFSDDGANNGISTASTGVGDLDMTGGDARDMAMDGVTGGAGLGTATGFGVDISGGMSGLGTDMSSGSDREADRGQGFGGIGENAFDGSSNDMSSGLEGSSSANASGGGGRDFGGRDKDLSSDDMSGGWGWGGMGSSSGGGWASDAFGGFDRGADLGIGMGSDNAWG